MIRQSTPRIPRGSILRRTQWILFTRKLPVFFNSDGWADVLVGIPRNLICRDARPDRGFTWAQDSLRLLPPSCACGMWRSHAKRSRRRWVARERSRLSRKLRRPCEDYPDLAAARLDKICCLRRMRMSRWEATRTKEREQRAKRLKNRGRDREKGAGGRKWAAIR